MLRLFDPSIYEGDRPYYEQHDPAMYTAEALAAREALRTNPVVMDACTRFSQVYQLEGGSVTWEEYQRVNMAVSAILAPHLEPREAAASVREDWARDADGAEVLDYSGLFWAIFEIADLWRRERRGRSPVATTASQGPAFSSLIFLRGFLRLQVPRDRRGGVRLLPRDARPRRRVALRWAPSAALPGSRRPAHRRRHRPITQRGARGAKDAAGAWRGRRQGGGGRRRSPGPGPRPQP